MIGGQVTRSQGLPPPPPSFLPSSLLLMCVVEQDGFDHAREDLGHVGAHDLRDHLREDDACLQRLGPHKQVVGELVELPHHLGEGGRRESARSVINNNNKKRVMRVNEPGIVWGEQRRQIKEGEITHGSRVGFQQTEL